MSADDEPARGRGGAAFEGAIAIADLPAPLRDPAPSSDPQNINNSVALGNYRSVTGEKVRAPVDSGEAFQTERARFFTSWWAPSGLQPIALTASRCLFPRLIEEWALTPRLAGGFGQCVNRVNSMRAAIPEIAGSRFQRA